MKTALSVSYTHLKLLGKKIYTFSGGSLSGEPLTITGVSAGKIWIDYSYSGNISGQTVTSAATVSGIGTVQAGFYAQTENKGFGTMYRGSVSYTHLDVYKRQPSDTASRSTAHTIRGLATFHGTGTKAPPTTTG